jgi:formylglycine-generating enzyme required for sulfatase activity
MLRYTCRTILVCLTLLALTLPRELTALLSHGQVVTAPQDRGQGVRIKFQGGKEIDLYGGSYALVIGISEYESGWARLPGVENDIKEVSGILTEHGFTIETLLNPKWVELNNSFRKFITTYGQERRNRLLIYFAGHGYTIKTPDNRELGYVVPADAPLPGKDTGQFKQLAVSMKDIESYAVQIEAKHALFVFDSCFSGTIFDAIVRRAPDSIAVKTAEPVRQFITAGTSEETVPDKSIFRQKFVTALRGKGDLNGDGYITGSELGQFLQDEITNLTRKEQKPQYGKMSFQGLDRGDFVFALPNASILPFPLDSDNRPVISKAELAEQEAWNVIAFSGRPQDFNRFLRRFPDGLYAEAARLRLIQLQENGLPRRRSISPTPIIVPPRGNPYRAYEFETVLLSASGKIVKRSKGRAEFLIEDLGDGVKLEMVRIPAGKFLMGNSEDEARRAQREYERYGYNVPDIQQWLRWELPQHVVSVKEFWIGKFEVTQAQWQTIAKLPKVNRDLSLEPSRFTGIDLPVENVSWEEAVEFCERLSRKTGRQYRLPTEAEWEYACRAGAATTFINGDTITPEVANYDATSPYGVVPPGEFRSRTFAVGSLGLANGFGLYDMLGNVWEWCLDGWHDSYDGAPKDGSEWREGADTSFRTIRGGAWDSAARRLRIANRNKYPPNENYHNFGLRVALASAGARSKITKSHKR